MPLQITDVNQLLPGLDAKPDMKINPPLALHGPFISYKNDTPSPPVSPVGEYDPIVFDAYPDCNSGGAPSPQMGIVLNPTMRVALSSAALASRGIPTRVVKHKHKDRLRLQVRAFISRVLTLEIGVVRVSPRRTICLIAPIPEAIESTEI